VIAFSGQLTGLFGQGSEVAAVVGRFFGIISIGYLLYMLTSCMQGYITGLGRPGMAMILLILYYIVFRIPTADVLRSLLGLEGIWYAFLASHVLALITGFIMVRIVKAEIDRKKQGSYIVYSN
jgi:Na+-driven multidrug efflux pump